QCQGAAMSDRIGQQLESRSQASDDTAAPHSPQSEQRQPLLPLLSTKVHRPRLRSHLISRTHLTMRLQQGLEGALILISAPAGFGKTTLLSQWLAEQSLPVAWLSLDAEDDDPVAFLSHLIAALQTVDKDIGATALPLLRSSQPASAEA